MLSVQALDTIKKAGSSFPKDEAKRLEKEVIIDFFEIMECTGAVITTIYDIYPCLRLMTCQKSLSSQQKTSAKLRKKKLERADW